jgi:hypothetical protein
MGTLRKGAKPICQAEIEKFDENHTEVCFLYYICADNEILARRLVYQIGTGEFLDIGSVEETPAGRAWLGWDDRSQCRFNGSQHDFGLRRSKEAFIIALHEKGIHIFNSDGSTTYAENDVDEPGDIGGIIIIEKKEDDEIFGWVTREREIVPTILTGDMELHDTRGATL